MNFQDLYKKIRAIDEGEIDRMNAQGFADQVPPGYYKTPQGELIPNNPAGQAQAQQQAAQAGQDPFSDRMSQYVWDQATKNGPKKLTPAQSAAQRTRNDAVWEEGEDECSSSVPSDQMLTSDESVEECGMDMMPPKAPTQSDSVTMNVSMNGSGKGGIRDLMDVLRNLENAVDEPRGHDEPDMIVGMEEELANTPHPEVADIDAVIPTGNDLASKGAEAEKVNGGGNPFNVDEALVRRLSALYQSIKEDRVNEYGATPGGTAAPSSVLAAQQDLVNLVKELSPSTNLSAYKADGVWGPQSQQLAEIAHNLILKMAPSSKPSNAQLAAYDRLNMDLKAGMVGHSGNGLAPGLRQGDKDLIPGAGFKAPTPEPMATKAVPATAPMATKAVNESADIVKLSKILNG